MMGSTNLLAAEGPVVLAWDSREILDVEVSGQEPRRLGNVLYYLPARLAIGGPTTFRSDLLRSTVVDADAVLFSKEPSAINFGRGSVTMAYRPIGFDGRLAPTELTIGLNSGEKGLAVSPVPVKPLPTVPPPCDPASTDDCKPELFDGLPEVEVFDAEAAAWKRLPHFESGNRYTVDAPTRYVDATTGTVLIRFVNDLSESVGFAVDLSISGTVE